MALTILKGKKFSVVVKSKKKRPDYVQVELVDGDRTPKVTHHLTPDECRVFAFALQKAAKA